MRLLLIEDEEMLGAVVKEGLEMARFEVVWEQDGFSGLERASKEAFSVVLLDVMLPGIDGWTLCRQLREQRNRTPILMMTARNGVEDRVNGLEMGADDYLPKPFAFAELRARVRALMRRESLQKNHVIRIADLEIDTGARRVTRAGREIGLTAREYALLEALATHPGQIFSQERILERVWGEDSAASNTVEVYVSMLRKKVDSGRRDKLIQTIRRLGYLLRPPLETV